MKKDYVVIFDLDGTLLNTDLLIQKSFEHVFEKYKPEYQLTKEDHLSFLGPLLSASFQRFFPDDMIDELIEYYRDYNHAHHEDFVTMYPTVKETLETLKEKGYPLAVVTTKLKEAACIGLDLFDLTSLFDCIIGCDEVKHSKPDPEGVFMAMEKTGCHKGVMIGDNPSDILTGMNAKIDTIGVKWSPKGTKDLEDLHPSLMIDTMSEIIPFIERRTCK